MAQMINLVDGEGKRIGGIEKLEAHREGKMHEAFSVFVFNDRGELLLQQRNPAKYHSGGLWTNTCCSHAELDEPLEVAVHRRLKEEMGFDMELTEPFPIHYQADVSNGLRENEWDYIFFGYGNLVPEPDPEEVSDWKWMNMEELAADIASHPEHYTEWLKIILKDERFTQRATLK